MLIEESSEIAALNNEHFQEVRIIKRVTPSNQLQIFN